MVTHPAIYSEGLPTNGIHQEAIASLLGRVDRKLALQANGYARRIVCAPTALGACPSEPSESPDAILSGDGFRVVRSAKCTEALLGGDAIVKSSVTDQKQNVTGGVVVVEDAVRMAAGRRDNAYVMQFHTHPKSVRSKHAAH